MSLFRRSAAPTTGARASGSNVGFSSGASLAKASNLQRKTIAQAPFSRAGAPPIPTGSRASMNRLVFSNTKPSSLGGGQVSKQFFGAGNRPSSTKGTSGLVKDTRPINDKEFQEHCAGKILAFLSEASYDSNLTIKSVLILSVKDFKEMLIFLMSFIATDFSTRLEKTKFIEYIPLLFKQLGYPTEIKKSTMQTIGTKTSAPHVLAAIAWLVDLLSYAMALSVSNLLFPPDESVGESDFDEFDDEEGRRTFSETVFEFQVSAYANRAQGTDLDVLAHDLQHQRSNFVEMVEKSRREHQLLVDKMERLQKEQKSVPELTAKNEQLQLEINRYIKFNDQQRAYNDKIEMEVAERKEQNAKKVAMIESLKQEIETKKLAIERQELKPEDVQRLNKQKEEWNTENATVMRDLEHAQHKFESTELQLSGHITKLKQKWNSFVLSADGLATRINMTFNFDSMSPFAAEFNSVQYMKLWKMMDSFLKSNTKTNNELNQRYLETEKELRERRAEISRTHSNSQLLEKELEGINFQLADLQRERDDRKDSLVTSLTELQAEITVAKTKLEQLKVGCKARESDCNEIQKKFESEEKAREEQATLIVEKLAAGVDAILEAKSMREAKVAEIAEHRRSRAEVPIMMRRAIERLEDILTDVDETILKD